MTVDMSLGPSEIAKYILSETSLDAKPSHVREVVEKTIRLIDGSLSVDEAIERAEKWWKKVIIYIVRDLSDCSDVGRMTRVVFNSSSEEYLQGACFEEPRDTDETKEKKKRRLSSDVYVNLLKKINPTQFELLCGKIIGFLGIEKPIVTKRSADEGIDFFGRLSLESMFFPNDLTPNMQTQLSVWMVGQAKHYQEVQTGTAEIRELVGSIELGKAQAYGSLTSPHPELKIRAVDAVFAIFITTGSISSNAWRLFNRSGVVGMDGGMVSAFLADRAAGLEGGALTEDKFLEWLGA